MEHADTSVEMPKYKCHKEVRALKIKALTATGSESEESDGSLWMTPDLPNYGRIHLSAGYVQKHRPHVGGYYVVYTDGYQSFSPAKAFEEGYSAI